MWVGGRVLLRGQWHYGWIIFSHAAVIQLAKSVRIHKTNSNKNKKLWVGRLLSYLGPACFQFDKLVLGKVLLHHFFIQLVINQVSEVWLYLPPIRSRGVLESLVVKSLGGLFGDSRIWGSKMLLAWNSPLADWYFYHNHCWGMGDWLTQPSRWEAFRLWWKIFHPCLKWVTFAKPWFWVSMLVSRGVHDYFVLKGFNFIFE